MRSQEINHEKLKWLISGLVDGGAFNEKISNIRKRLRLPKNGLKTNEASQKWHEQMRLKDDKLMFGKEWSLGIRKLDRLDPDYKKNLREYHKKLDVNYLTYSIDEIVEDNPDLNRNFKDAIRSYILFGSIGSPGNYRVYSKHEGGK